MQIKTHIKRYMNKEITYQNIIFNPRHILEYLFSFSCYFYLVFTIWKVQTNNSNENAKNVTHGTKKLKIAHTVLFKQFSQYSSLCTTEEDGPK